MEWTCNAQRYERSDARRDTRGRPLRPRPADQGRQGKWGVPKLRRRKFESDIIERYPRPESSVEKALMEICLAGVSVRRVEDITEALWGDMGVATTVSDLNKKIYGTIEAWRNRPIEGKHSYGHLEKFFSPSRCESDSLTAMGHGRMERSHG